MSTRKLISILIVFGFLFNCKKNRQSNELNSFLEINIKDTLSKKTVFGSMNFKYIVNDTVKLTSKDNRVLFIYINVFDKTKKIEEITEVECDTFFNSTKNFKETLNTKFYISPKESGKKIVAGFVEEILFLHGYKYKDTNKIRKIVNRHYFKKEIIVK